MQILTLNENKKGTLLKILSETFITDLIEIFPKFFCSVLSLLFEAFKKVIFYMIAKQSPRQIFCPKNSALRQRCAQTMIYLLNVAIMTSKFCIFFFVIPFGIKKSTYLMLPAFTFVTCNPLYNEAIRKVNMQ
jgi:hypothetical protein